MGHHHDARFLHMVEACQDFYANIPWVSAEQFLHQHKEDDWYLVDVRTVAEMAVSILPGAIALQEYETHLKVYTGHPALVYCTVGCRSAGVTQTLQDQGIEAYNLWGGVVDWALHGGDFVTPEGAFTREVHTHGRRWNLLPQPYIAVW